MLQIKTIRKADPCKFDQAVNSALAEGWQLTRRITGPDHFVAEMEQVIITDAEKCCENCKHKDKSANVDPCLNCTETDDRWEPVQ